MRLADSHIHLFSADDLPAYERLRTEHDITDALVVGFEGTPAHRGNNDAVLAAARTRPYLTPLAYVPTAGPDPDRIAGLVAAGHRGLSLYVTDEHAADRLATWPAAAIDAVATHCQIVSVNARASLIARVAATLAAMAPATVLISHLGLPGRFRRAPRAQRTRLVIGALLDLAGEDHVAVKISAPYATSEPRHRYPHATARPFVDALFDAFGPQRLYWGSDFPPALNFVSFAQTVDCYLPHGLPDSERAAVLGGNLRSIL